MGFEEAMLIAIIALVVIGPQRLPEYAEQLGKLVRNARQMATGATQTIREELGDDIADLDLTKFDPRQYDPRRIVREALLEDLVPSSKPATQATAAAATVKPRSPGGPDTVAADDVADLAEADAESEETEQSRPAPFDDEAT